MKKRVVWVLAVLLLLALLPSALADSIYNYDLYKVMSQKPNGYCYLYSEPSSSNGRNLGRHDNGEIVGVISHTDEHGGFYYVYCSNGKYGYIHDYALTPLTRANADWYVVASTKPNGYCYLYSEPSSSNGRNLGRYDNGELVEIIDWDASDNYAYVRCERTGDYGYIRKTSLEYYWGD